VSSREHCVGGKALRPHDVGEERVRALGASCSATIFLFTNIFFVLPRKFVPEQASTMHADATRRHEVFVCACEIIDITPLQPGIFLHSRTPSAQHKLAM
jgi:hypothetical protein